MLTLWVPATQHCALEAAGMEFFAHCEHDDSSCEDVCASDVCQTIEGASIGGNSHALRVLPPTAHILGFCLLHLIPPPSPVDDEEGVSADDPPEVQILYRTWQFVRRTALPARAPDCVA